MKIFTFFGLFAAIVAVHGAPRTLHINERDWMIFPGCDGTAHLALLSHPVNKPSLIDPVAQVTFHLYTRNNRDFAQQIWVGNVDSASFEPHKPTKFLVHGFSSNSYTHWVMDFKNKLLDAEDCNVITVDWSSPAQGPLYNDARANVSPAGKYIGAMYDYLDRLGHSLEDTQCIGHSLGAHVCGFSGKAVEGTLGRVTGLDPALPLFEYSDPASRLAKTDATYVDVIHTCSGWLSFAEPLGHADFYPNGGFYDQPGCDIDVTGGCSHGRAYDFYGESIVTGDFIGFQCDTWSNFQNGVCFENKKAVMGYQSNSSTMGTFYFATAENSPFALG